MFIYIYIGNQIQLRGSYKSTSDIVSKMSNRLTTIYGSAFCLCSNLETH